MVATNRTYISPNGVITGTGTLAVNFLGLQNDGTLAPGINVLYPFALGGTNQTQDAAATMSISGTLTLGSTDELAVIALGQVVAYQRFNMRGVSDDLIKSGKLSVYQDALGWKLILPIFPAWAVRILWRVTKARERWEGSYRRCIVYCLRSGRWRGVLTLCFRLLVIFRTRP